jgi:hypothetical protein
MRGKYLAGNFGVCMECHTEHVQTPGAVPINTDKLFAGGDSFVSAAIGVPSPPYPPVIFSENITPHATGVQGWTAAAIANVMKNGVDKDGLTICPPMPNGPNGAFGGLTDGDRLDIGNYIVHLPPIDNTVALICHDIMNSDGGTDGGRDATPPTEASVDSTPPPVDATQDITPDTTPTPDATGDSAGDTGGNTDGTSGDGSTNDGTPGDGPSGDGSTGDGSTGDGSTGDGASGDAADSAG